MLLFGCEMWWLVGRYNFEDNSVSFRGNMGEWEIQAILERAL
jgi:hypothetical protein